MKTLSPPRTDFRQHPGSLLDRLPRRVDRRLEQSRQDDDLDERSHGDRHVVLEGPRLLGQASGRLDKNSSSTPGTVPTKRGVTSRSKGLSAMPVFPPAARNPGSICKSLRCRRTSLSSGRWRDPMIRISMGWRPRRPRTVRALARFLLSALIAALALMPAGCRSASRRWVPPQDCKVKIISDAEFVRTSRGDYVDGYLAEYNTDFRKERMFVVLEISPAMPRTSG